MELCRKASVPFVRRITGGGMIFHGNEMTYSIACSKEDLGIKSGIALSYRTICVFLISFYRSLGIDAAFACDASGAKEELGRPTPICFAAREKYDIVVAGKKIGGSAQKRSRDVIFQHGSIPVNFDHGVAHAYVRDGTGCGGRGEVTCLRELLGFDIKSSMLEDALIGSFRKSFDINTEESGLTEAEQDIAEDLIADKYASSDWNFNRARRAMNCAELSG